MRWASLVYVSLPLSCWLSTCSCGFVCLDLFDCVLAHVRLFAFACTKLLRVSNPPHSRVQVFPWPSSLEWLSFKDWAPGRISSNFWCLIPEANAFSVWVVLPVRKLGARFSDWRGMPEKNMAAVLYGRWSTALTRTSIVWDTHQLHYYTTCLHVWPHVWLFG